jgi:hypothetical protein
VKKERFLMGHTYDESFEELRKRQEQQRKDADLMHARESKMTVSECYRAIFSFYERQWLLSGSDDVKKVVDSLKPGLELIEMIEQRAK